MSTAATQSARPLIAGRLDGHLPPLDGLRGIAVLTVMIMHFTIIEGATALDRAFVGAMEAGWIGVDLFFVLSGFLITGILVKSREKPAYFRNFYARRTLRIFPLYYAFLVLLFVVLPAVSSYSVLSGTGEDSRLWIWAYLSNVLMAIDGWEGLPGHTTHLWSLAIEEQFYLVWPLIVFLVPRRQLAWLCGIAIGVSAAARLGMYALTDSGIAGYVLTICRLDGLAVGSLLALLLRDPRGHDLLRRALRPAAVASLLLIAAAAAFNLSRGAGQPLPPMALSVQLIAYPALAVAFGCLLVGALGLRPEQRLHAALTGSTLTFFGRYSYALYLLHVPLRDLLRNSMDLGSRLPFVFGSQLIPQLAVIAAGIAVSSVFAYISWHLFEKHFVALKRYFEDAPRPKTALEPRPVEGIVEPTPHPAPLGEKPAIAAVPGPV